MASRTSKDDKLETEKFIRTINDSRTAQGASILNFAFDKKRCRILTKCDNIKEETEGILYWMSRECRVQDNWTFLYAQRLALKNDLPLIVCFLCKDVQYLYPTKRQFNFLLHGLKYVETECMELNIKFYFLNCTPIELARTIKSNNIGGVVCDFNPLKTSVKWTGILAKNLPNDIPLIQVDGHNIVPCWEASSKEEVMAKTIRPKITKQLPDYLTGFPDVTKHPFSGKFSSDFILTDVDKVFYEPQWEVDELTWLKPGPEGGFEMLMTFITDRLKYYGINSNDPSKNNTSNLSPWLHFGQISAQRCALEVKRMEYKFKEQVGTFLEELIIRKELADNYCFYNSNYDNINGAPKWAFNSLSNHKTDKRNYIYTREEFEKGLTHDEIWNAAQVQLLQEGKIHGYMRMYWCKKILEWTESPEQAIEFALWLNDTFSIDGTDPNGFVGVMWSICGVHDQGWKEREIFGKIRFMVDYSLRRKFKIDAYCARYKTITPTSSRKSRKRKLQNEK